MQHLSAKKRFANDRGSVTNALRAAVKGLVLSLFPGIGLLDRAFEEAGFCVVRGPDVLWGGDVRLFHPPAGRFDGVIGGPPCQFASRMRHVNPRCGEKHGNLIPEFCRVVGEAKPRWFVMENVKDAPLPEVPGYTVHAQMLKDEWVGGASSRERRISFGTHAVARLNIETLAVHHPASQLAAYAQGNGRPVPIRYNSHDGELKLKKSAVLNETITRAEYWKHMLTAQGLPEDFLSEAPFTEAGKKKAVGNGVPLPMGRAIAAAVLTALYPARCVECSQEADAVIHYVRQSPAFHKFMQSAGNTQTSTPQQFTEDDK